MISRTSAVQYNRSGKTIREIGQDLGAGYVLEGTVRWDQRAGSRVRITPQLIRVSDDTHLWTERYDRILDDIFAVQSEIAQNVISHLEASLLEGGSRALATKPTGWSRSPDWLELKLDFRTTDQTTVYVGLLAFGPEVWFDGVELHEDDSVEIGVQVNGRTRGTVVLAPDASEDDARTAALAVPSVARQVEGKQVRKFIYVPRKIINFVAR